MNYTYRQKSKLSVNTAVERLLIELARQTDSISFSAIISTNVRVRIDGLPYSDQKEPADPGVAVYWKRKGREQCMAIDRYDRVADNIAAIAATLEALRAIERHGGGSILDRAFEGFAQLPPAIIASRPWREVLGFKLESRVTLDEAESAFRRLSLEHHPDQGGHDERMRELLEARRQARAELAGKGAAA